MVALARLRAQLHQVLHLNESPHRTALAFAVGVFIAFSPTYGLHTLMVLFCTWAFRLNLLAVMLGALVNNPWTFVPILGATIWTGLQMLGMPPAEPPTWSDVSVASLYQQLMPYLLPFVIGGLSLSLVGALLGYPLAYWVLVRYRSAKKRPQPEGRLLT